MLVSGEAQTLYRAGDIVADFTLTERGRCQEHDSPYVQFSLEICPGTTLQVVFTDFHEDLAAGEVIVDQEGNDNLVCLSLVTVRGTPVGDECMTFQVLDKISMAGVNSEEAYEAKLYEIAERFDRRVCGVTNTPPPAVN